MVRVNGASRDQLPNITTAFLEVKERHAHRLLITVSAFALGVIVKVTTVPIAVETLENGASKKHEG